MDSSTHMHGLAVDLKEGLPLAWDLSLENSVNSYFFDWPYLTQFLTSLAWDLSLENSVNSYFFDWPYLTQFLTSSYSIDHLLHL